MKSVMGLFQRYEDAERAIENLDNQEFPKRDISVITLKQVMHNYLAGYDRIGSGATMGAIRGAALGGLTGLLVGLGATIVPGIGPVLMVGAVATAVGAATGSLVAALLKIGVPRKLAAIYEAGIQRGQILVAVHSEQRVDEAKTILHQTGARHVYAFHYNGDDSPLFDEQRERRVNRRRRASSTQASSK